MSLFKEFGHCSHEERSVFVQEQNPDTWYVGNLSFLNVALVYVFNIGDESKKGSLLRF